MSLTEIMTEVPDAGVEERIEGRTPWQLAWRRLRKDRVAIACVIFIVLLILVAVFAPQIARWVGFSPTKPDTNNGLDNNGLPYGPGTKHWFGTDELGRDLFTRAVYGARVSLFVGLVSTAIATTVGVTIGLLAGYFGGWVDAIISRLVEVILSYPYLIVGLVAAATIGPSEPMEIAVISFFSFSAIARVIRGQVLFLKHREFIEAARSLGASRFRIMFVDILPNLTAPTIVLASLAIPAAIVFESTLTFLGAGIDPSIPSWGGMLSESTQYYRYAWWYLLTPSVLLLLTTLAFNLLGDGIRDALDPRADQVLTKTGK